MPRPAATSPPGSSGPAAAGVQPSLPLPLPRERWEAPGTSLHLGAGGLAVFLVPVAPLPCWTPLLSDADRAELRRWRRPADQARFASARGALRSILSRVPGSRPAAELLFARTPRGRLFLDPADGRADLDFNLSHAGDFILIAVCSHGRVGVDIECGTRKLDIAGISRLVLTAAERDRLAACRDEAERRAVFFTCWVRKEAVAKADGRGLACGLRQIPVLDDGRAGVARLSLADEAGVARSWRVLDLEVPAGYHGALATDLPAALPRLFLLGPEAADPTGSPAARPAEVV